MARWKNTLEERFWAHVDRSGGPDGCWPWLAGRFSTGYGAFAINRRNSGAHRIAWEFTHGPIPEGMFVLHHCDNRPCCNPHGDKHLFVGTQAENMADMIAKGRQGNTSPKRPATGNHCPYETRPRGAKHGCAKLTEADIPEIRLAVRSGEKQRDVGRRFGVSQRTIWSIVHRRIWAHVR